MQSNVLNSNLNWYRVTLYFGLDGTRRNRKIRILKYHNNNNTRLSTTYTTRFATTNLELIFFLLIYFMYLVYLGITWNVLNFTTNFRCLTQYSTKTSCYRFPFAVHSYSFIHIFIHSHINCIIYCFRFINASIHSLKLIIQTLHSSITLLYIPSIIPSLYLSVCKERSTVALENTISRAQCLASHVGNSQWIMIFRDYMNRKMTFAPTSMCRVTLTVTPYFAGIFIWFQFHIVVNISLINISIISEMYGVTTQIT